VARIGNIIRLKGGNPFAKRSARAQGPVTAIDIDGPTLRVVQGAPKGDGFALTKVSSAKLDLAEGADRNDPAVMGRAIAKALDELKLRPGAVVMGVPRAQVVLRTLQLPVIPDVRELASMVHLQVGRDLPFRMDEAVVDFKVRRQITPTVPTAAVVPVEKIEALPTPKLEVLVAAVKKEVVEAWRQTAELAGVKLAALGLLPYANARCVEACHVADGDEAFALISLRPDEANIDVIAEQALLFSRGAQIRPGYESQHADPNSAEPPPPPPRNEQEWASEYVDLVTIEVVRTLHAFTGLEPNSSVGKVVVSGATGFEAATLQSLAKRVGRPCALLDPGSALGFADEDRREASGAVAAIGLALGAYDPQGLPFDFLNPKKPAVQRDMARIRLLAGVAAAAAAIVFVLALKNYLVTKRTNLAKEWADKVAAAEKFRPIYRKVIAQGATVDDWQKGKRNWLDHFAYLTAVLPASEEIYITSLAITGQGTIRMAVQAQSGEVLAQLDKKLRAAGYDVKPFSITPGADRLGYEFRSTVELTVPAKMKPDFAKVKAPARPADDASLDPNVAKGRRG
jgi:Tfp pilus assembly PilM family ATPase